MHDLACQLKKIFFYIHLLEGGGRHATLDVYQMRYADLDEIRGQLLGVDSLLLPHGTWGLTSGCQTWQESPLPTEPVCQFLY